MIKRKALAVFHGITRVGYPVFHWVMRLLAMLPRINSCGETVDLVCVVPGHAHGWILEKIARVIVDRYPGTCRLVDSPYSLPPARRYLFLHYDWMLKSLKLCPQAWRAPVVAWYTHPEPINASLAEQKLVYNRFAWLISACQLHRQGLISNGVSPDRVFSVVGVAADAERFHPVTRTSDPVVGLVGAYYPRKNAQALADIVVAMPEVEFRLLGKGWDHWEGFENLRGHKNFSYVEAPYEEYPQFYQGLNVFLSLSLLEGGPFPLVEAMMSNVIPVVTRTGVAPELISHGENGYLFDPGASAETVKGLIKEALENRKDIAADVQQFTWTYLADQLCQALGKASR